MYTLCVLWSQFLSKLHETLSECLSPSNLGHIYNWVTSGQKLGHKVKSKKKKTCVLSVRYSLELILMNICQNVCHHENRTGLKVGLVGSEKRS